VSVATSVEEYIAAVRAGVQPQGYPVRIARAEDLIAAWSETPAQRLAAISERWAPVLAALAEGPDADDSKESGQ
jgi:hypothetical protein